jgi:hypothetical protein|tara:strand:- start:1096 stop:1302 length:207 start_codon:yes stop_codon:yes gene_type:complete
MITIHKYELEILLEGIEDTLRVVSGVDYSTDSYDPRNVEKTAPYVVGYSKSSLRLIHETLTRMMEDDK